MPGVVGRGERRHPHNGNATLTTYGLDGNRVTTPLWMSAFATDLNLQLDSAQRRTGLSHRPIRITERMLSFSALWNVRDRPKYARLVQAIKTHWALNFNEQRPTPMKLEYYGANKTWLGNIENASFAFAVTDVVLSYSFQMRVIPSPTGQISRVAGSPAPYVPHRGDIVDFGNNWYAYAEFIAQQVGVGHEGAGGADTRPNPTNTGGGGGGVKK